MSKPFQILDAAAWVGQYPFRGIAGSSLEDFRNKMQALDIGRAVVSPFEAIFWENNLDAYCHWERQLSGYNEFELWPVVNPAMPGQVQEFQNLWDRGTTRPAGLRLTPNYHGYRLDDPCVAELMEVARKRDLVVQLFTRIADERWHWMLRTPGVSEDDVLYFTSAFAGMRLLISGLNNLQFLISRLKQQPRLHVDLSRHRGPIFGVEKLLGRVPPAQVVFGSLWPIQIVEATLWQILEARIDDSMRAAVLGGNLTRLLKTDHS